MRLTEEIKKCSLCQAVLIYYPPTKPKTKDFYWKCQDCGAEVWPEDISVRKQIRRDMGEGMKTKKRGGRGSRKKRKVKKPGEKFIPWYQRYGNQ